MTNDKLNLDRHREPKMKNCFDNSELLKRDLVPQRGAVIQIGERNEDVLGRPPWSAENVRERGNIGESDRRAGKRGMFIEI